MPAAGGVGAGYELPIPRLQLLWDAPQTLQVLQVHVRGCKCTDVILLGMLDS